jgi:hypothetical protein
MGFLGSLRRHHDLLDQQLEITIWQQRIPSHSSGEGQEEYEASDSG